MLYFQPAPANGSARTPDSQRTGVELLMNAIGSMRLDVLAGDPATAADEADVAAVISISDVRRRSDLSDHTG